MSGMGMMYATGPLGRHPAGHFNQEQTLYLDPCAKRVRVIVNDATVADSIDTILLQEQGLQPVYYFPPGDVDANHLVPSDRATYCPKKGDASYYSVKVGKHEVKNCAWYYPEPKAGAQAIAGYIAFYWDRVDHWYEEAEEVFVHPRDPYHRVDIIPSSRHIKVSFQGQTLAETTRATALFESNLPTRWYIPREDIVAPLQPSEAHTGCPYKGQASYHSVDLPDDKGTDIVWCYQKPLTAAQRIAGLHAFYNERVDIEVDGILQPRP
jgi:uncharacterized protein (DUF427 family)